MGFALALGHSWARVPAQPCDPRQHSSVYQPWFLFHYFQKGWGGSLDCLLWGKCRREEDEGSLPGLPAAPAALPLRPASGGWPSELSRWG